MFSGGKKAQISQPCMRLYGLTPGKVIIYKSRGELSLCQRQSYEIKSPPWAILWFRILGFFSVENIVRLDVFIFQTSDNSQLCIDSQYSSQQLTIGASFKHKNTQPLYIFNRENPQNSEPQNGLRRGLDFIALNNYMDSMAILVMKVPSPGDTKLEMFLPTNQHTQKKY